MGKHIPRVKGKRQTKRANPKKIAKAAATITKGTGKSSSKAPSRVLGEADTASISGKSRPGKQERAMLSNSSITNIGKENPFLQEGKVAKTKRGARILKSREPLLVENDKKVLIIKGGRTSQVINNALKDITSLTKPLCKTYSRNNDLLPFEVSLQSILSS